MIASHTTDMGMVRAVFNHESIRHDVWNDGIPKALPVGPTIYYLLIKDERFSDGAVEDVLLGTLMFVPENHVTWTPHIAILPEHRGCGTEAMRLGMEWMFKNTPCVKLVAKPPVFNAAMIRVFQKCGWKYEGYSPASFMWNGVLHDRLMLGIGKQEH